MSDPVFDEASWYRALNLSECAAAFRSSPPPPASTSEAPVASGRQFQAWTKQAPFGDGDWLLRRLALDGLDESSFSRLLSLSPDQLRSLHSQSPGWLVKLRETYSGPGDGEPASLP